MKWLKRFWLFWFCSHKGVGLEFVRNVYGDGIIANNYQRSIWCCPRCGRLVRKPDLYNP